MDFTLDQLQVLDAIARRGSFAAAAAHLHRVPSAITYQVRTLESALEVELFDRSGRSAVLTSAGERVVEAARDVLERARALERVAAELRGGWEAELHVVVDAALPMEPLAACLRRFGDGDVPTRLRVDVECQEGVLDRFESSPADVALYLGFDSDAEAAPYRCEPLPPLPFVLVATPSHGAAQPGAARGAFTELVVQDTASRFSRRAKPAYSGAHNVVYLADFHAKRLALLAGAGFGWVPEHLVDADLAAGTLTVLPGDGSRWAYRPQVVTRRRDSPGRAARLFVETLLASVVR